VSLELSLERCSVSGSTNVTVLLCMSQTMIWSRILLKTHKCYWMLL